MCPLLCPPSTAGAREGVLPGEFADNSDNGWQAIAGYVAGRVAVRAQGPCRQSEASYHVVGLSTRLHPESPVARLTDRLDIQLGTGPIQLGQLGIYCGNDYERRGRWPPVQQPPPPQPQPRPLQRERWWWWRRRPGRDREHGRPDAEAIEEQQQQQRSDQLQIKSSGRGGGQGLGTEE